MRKGLPFQDEADFVGWLRRAFPTRATGVRMGIGDDAALVWLHRQKEMILTADMSIEGVHFRTDLHPPDSVGHRALARSLSDIAAMGGVPRHILISIALSQHMTKPWLLGVYRGIAKLARRFGSALIGGDTAVTPGPTTLDAVVTGEVEHGRALLRSGARPGDLIFVSGKLGLSALGLRLLLAKVKPKTSIEKMALQAHLYPEPQCALGRFLCERRLATAMMDLSDGLSIDLKRLCAASGVRAKLYADKIPAPNLPNTDDALKLALHGGEDYQLLFTVSPRKATLIPKRLGKVPLHCIGEVERGRAVTLIPRDGKPLLLKPLGWDHFARRSKR